MISHYIRSNIYGINSNSLIPTDIIITHFTKKYINKTYYTIKFQRFSIFNYQSLIPTDIIITHFTKKYINKIFYSIQFRRFSIFTYRKIITYKNIQTIISSGIWKK